jgi:hypothetical protein
LQPQTGLYSWVQKSGFGWQGAGLVGGAALSFRRELAIIFAGALQPPHPAAHPVLGESRAGKARRRQGGA